MPITPIHTIRALQDALAGRQPGLVPTMGALHEGHAGLIRRAREVAGPELPVVVSVFVNPAQFAPNEDFTRYPRQLAKDIAISEQAGATIVFAPEVREMYPLGTDAVADDFIMPALPDVATQPQLEDAFRPGHFLGVCKVVARLFDIVQPSRAIFGEKDYQQLRVISDMVNEGQPRWPSLQIVAHPTIREPDGLAMSSRNVYLKPGMRDRALALHQALKSAQAFALRGDAPQEIENLMTFHLFMHQLEADYAVLRDAVTLMPVERVDRPCRGLIAARMFGESSSGVRLIDNMPLAPAATP